MKKFTLVALACAAGMTASAQYNVDPTVETVLAKGKVAEVQYIALDEASVKAFQDQGATTTLVGPNGETQNLWVWDNTFGAGDSSYPGVGMHFDGYASFSVGTIGWSGAGYNVAAPGFNSSNWNDETRFHLAYMSPGTVCPSVGLIIADGPDGNTAYGPAKVSLGAAFNDNGTAFPSIGTTSSDDWQAIDISFGDLKKIFKGFNYSAAAGWTGNIMSFLCGGVTGQTIAFDAVYFYNYANNGVDDLELNDENAPAEYFNLQGVRVDGELAPGLYIVRKGSSVSKVTVK